MKNELMDKKERLMTTRELAKALGVDVKTVNNTAERLKDLLGSTSQKASGGRPTKVFTEEQATLIKQEIQKHHNLFGIEKVKNTITVKEIAEELHVSKQTIRNIVQELFDPAKVLWQVVNGVNTLFLTYEQATAIKIELQNHSKVKMMTTRELAETLGVSLRTVQQIIALKGYEINFIPLKTNGGIQKVACVTEAQATAIKIELQNHSKVAQNGFNTLTINNDLEMLLMQQKLNEYQNMRIQQLTSELNSANAQLIEQEPDVEFSRKIQSSSSVLKVSEIAKVLELGYGDRTLYKKLVELGILMKDHTPYQEYMNRGYFKVCISHHEENSELVADKTTKIYMKGCFYIARKLGVVGKAERIHRAYSEKEAS